MVGSRLKKWAEATALYREPKVLAFLLFGFSSGLPLALTGETLRFWFTDAKVDLGVIGLTSLIGTAYTIKFLWAPIVDRISFGPIGARFGRRRIWMILTQIAMAGLIFVLATTHPGRDLMFAIWLCIGIAFLSATQDIVIDAYRIERLDEERLAAGTAAYSYGWYFAARLIGGAVVLEVAHLFTWNVAYAVMGLLMGVGMLAVILNPEPKNEASEEIAMRRAEVQNYLADKPRLGGVVGDFIGFLYVSVVSPFLDIARRQGKMLIPLLLLIILFKFQDAFAQVMAGPFVRGEVGFSKEEIALVYKTIGIGGSFLGFFVAGLMIKPLGLFRSLWIGGILQMISNFGYCWLDLAGHDLFALGAVNCFENFASGLGNTIFVVFISRLCSSAYTATQYALLSALAMLARTFLVAPGGYLVEAIGWFNFFFVSGLSALPGLALVWYIWRSPYGEAVRQSEAEQNIG